MDTGFDFFAVSALVVILTGISKSGFAGGLSIIAVPAMSLFVTPQFAAAVMLPILCVIDLAAVWHYRQTWSRRIVMLLVPGMLLGVAVGALTFRLLEPALLKLGVGALALGFVASHLWSARAAKTLITSANEAGHAPPRSLLALACGALAGFTSFVAHAGGPPVKGYLLSQSLHKSLFVGTNSYFFFVMNQIKLFTYLGIGQFSSATLTASLYLLPMIPVGVWIGFRLHDRIDQTNFLRVAYLLLSLAGLKLLWDGARYYVIA